MIRLATLKDLTTLVAFQCALSEETEDFSLDPKTVELGIRAIFQNPSKGTYYVYQKEGHQVSACLLTTPEWSDWRNGTVLWIQSVYVTPLARSKGVFGEMYGYLKNKVLRHPDLYGLRLFVEKNNKKAQRVYAKMGMGSEHYELYEWMQSENTVTKPSVRQEDSLSQTSMANIFEAALPMASRLMLRSDFGICEIRGEDLCYKVSKKSVTVYHRSAKNSEARSHVHLSHGVYKRCRFFYSERNTPYLAFFKNDKENLAQVDFKIYLKLPWLLEKDLVISG